MDAFVTSFEEIGRAEGLAEGALRGQRTLILHQLGCKLGPLNEALQARINALAAPQLLSLSDALLDFTNQADLVTWLDRYR